MERYREMHPSRCLPSSFGDAMDLFRLTRGLIDIESITSNEKQVASCLLEYLSALAEHTGGLAERMEVEPDRFNVFACWGDPRVTLTTHMDVVTPFFPYREDDEFIYGRGACDAKGIIASMIEAAEKLLQEGQRNFALLFVVGEERNSAGALAAARQPRGSRFLINGEPTDNKLAAGSKGALRYELVAHGRMAHSAYPELGESAIDKLLDTLERIRKIPLPEDALLGPSTLSIGTISVGHAPNVVSDFARAEVMIRLVGSPEGIREAVNRAAAGRADLREVLMIPALRLKTLDDLETTVVSFTTDIPVFGGAWGQPFLLGPGNIHVAHTMEEKVSKRQLIEAVEIYRRMVKRLAAGS